MIDLTIYIAIRVVSVATLILMSDSDKIVLTSYITFAKCRTCRANSNTFKENLLPLLDRVKKVFIIYINVLDQDIKVFC